MITLMAHLVAEFPDTQTALTAARALVAGGSRILEIQLPFSDPSADGVAIQGACAEVLAHGRRTADAFDFIAQLHREFPSVTLYIMAYASLVYTPGVLNFCRRVASCGVNGLIVPDLPFDCDEGLRDACCQCGMEFIPVASPSMDRTRLEKLTKAGFAHIYASLRAGITGTDTIIDRNTLDFLSAVSAHGAGVFGGFGISTGAQSAAVAPYVSAVVAGSVFVRLIAANRGCASQMAAAVQAKACELCSGSAASA